MNFAHSSSVAASSLSSGWRAPLLNVSRLQNVIGPRTGSAAAASRARTASARAPIHAPPVAPSRPARTNSRRDSDDLTMILILPFWFQPFTEPAASPPTRDRWNSLNRRTIGTVVSVAMANSVV